MSDQLRSPIKANPLRTPGQSCEEQRERIFDNKLELPILAVAVGVGLTCLEFWRAYSNQPPAPWVYASFTFAAIAFLGIRARKYLPQMKNLKLAAEGEKVVGQYLEKLRSEGYEVLHDIPAPSFNVDHVLVGPAGIFSVETKTWSKPSEGEAKILFDGKTLTKGGLTPERDPVTQARAQASWLSQLVEDGTGRKYQVKPIVLFPGWWIEQSEGSLRQIWVLEPKALPKFLKRESVKMQEDEIKLVAYHLSRYVRTFESV